MSIEQNSSMSPDAVESLTISVQDRAVEFCYPDTELGAAMEELSPMRVNYLVSLDQPPVPAELRPMLSLGTRVYADAKGVVHFSPRLIEKGIERHADRVVICRIHRDVRVSGAASLAWDLVRWMDGTRTTAEILEQFGVDRERAGELLAALVSTGVIDASGRPIARFLHHATKRAVLTGRLTREEIVALTSASEYRVYPAVPRISLGAEIPESLRALHEITHARRSGFEFTGRPIARADFDAMLATACGTTGVLRETINRGGQTVKGRAYPSPGALYAIEVYPVVFAVEGLDPAIYHYRATEHAMETVRTGIDRSLLADAALPDQRHVVPFDGVAVVFCLTATFQHPELKYGEGIYRTLAIEAGHISENLLLAATALGLKGRPVGGYFDDLVNKALGLESDDEQFMFSVLVGHAET